MSSPQLYFHMVNSKGKAIYSNLSGHCLKCFENCSSSRQSSLKCQVTSQPRKFGKTESSHGKAFLCVNDSNIVRSSRLFKEKLGIYGAVLEELDTMRSEITAEINVTTKRLLHNLSSLNGKNIQEIYDLVSQEALTGNINEQLKIVKTSINSNLTDAATAILKIAKYNAAIKTEFAVFKKLYETSPVLQFKEHLIRKVTLNILHIFFQDFTDKHVYVEVEPFDGKVELDYESIHVVLYHVIDNTAKYIQPHSILLVSFSHKNKVTSVIFDMMSLQISDEDIKNIFLEGYSGTWARKQHLAGDGIGMSIVQSILKLNRAEIRITRNKTPAKNVNIGNLPYENNVFEITFGSNP
ncbi:MAG: hypothetical protein Q7T53_12285 [Deltaproteobacteria bacterium]|nr:hypothetical protein [Deltaproteobacteria bacterium]